MKVTTSTAAKHTTALELPVMEAFYTIQGEGYFTGTPAYFIRTGGCLNLLGCFLSTICVRVRAFGCRNWALMLDCGAAKDNFY